MIAAGLSTLLIGLFLVLPRFEDASGAERLLVFGPVFEAAALTIFAAEHFVAARDLMGIVPHWLPGPLFWTYFVGAALLAAAISFITWQHVNLSASLLALLFLIIVLTIDLPTLPAHIHERFFWILAVRETTFAAGALVLAGSVLRSRSAGTLLITLGRLIVACACIFYAVEHFLFPQFVPGVPLEKPMPSWFPFPQLLAYLIGLTLLVCGIGLLLPRTARIAAATAGTLLVLLTFFFYVPILITELHTPLAMEGINYVGDTLLFAATILLAGLGADRQRSPENTAAPRTRKLHAR